VAIGPSAGFSCQSCYAIAIGVNAGNACQGINAVAIGAAAGTCSQAANSIAINATGTALNPTTCGFFVKPVRVCCTACTQSPVFYNPTTGEFVI
jgi:hypothetical protein